jgi:hypothetical protein
MSTSPRTTTRCTAAEIADVTDGVATDATVIALLLRFVDGEESLGRFGVVLPSLRAAVGPVATRLLRAAESLPASCRIFWPSPPGRDAERPGPVPMPPPLVGKLSMYSAIPEIGDGEVAHAVAGATSAIAIATLTRRANAAQDLRDLVGSDRTTLAV